MDQSVSLSMSIYKHVPNHLYLEICTHVLFRTMLNALHPPRMRVNLLSVSALEDVGYSTLFQRGHVYIFPDRDDLGHVYIFSERARLIDP